MDISSLQSLRVAGKGWMVLYPLFFVLSGIQDCPCVDCDSDGWTVEDGDCDDQDPSTYPGAEEVCDPADNNCDGEINEDIMIPWYLDQDGDGYGVADVVLIDCEQPDGFAEHAGDCNDEANTVHPNAWEDCDGVDDDCDGEIDEGATTTFYLDQDGDSYGQSDSSMEACSRPEGYSFNGTDCDDADPEIFPGQTDGCDGMDNDCDGHVDEAYRWYRDVDGDGIGDTAAWQVSCTFLEGYAHWGGDCDEGDPLVHPAALETCNGKDDDCNQIVDDVSGLYVDRDGDGYGGDGACVADDGTTELRGDCDDTDADVHPGATDLQGDDRDQDCGGFDGPDPHVGLSGDSYEEMGAALEAAREGATIWVGPGAYLDRIEIEGQNVRLRSTVIGEAVYSYYSVIFRGDIGPETEFDGFSLTYGTLEISDGASPIVRDCTVSRAEYGGAVLITGDGTRPIFKRTEISSNGSPYDEDGNGAALGIYRASPLLSQCRISENVSRGWSGAYGDDTQTYGAGIYLEDASPVFRDCEISDNRIEESSTSDCSGFCHYSSGTTRKGDGGGVYALRSDAVFMNCTISANLASRGGGLFATESRVALYNCLLSDNEAYPDHNWASGLCNEDMYCSSASYFSGIGGALYLSESALFLHNSVLLGNDALEAGALRVSSDAVAEIDGSLFSGNGILAVQDYSCVDDSCTYTPMSGETGGIECLGEMALSNAIVAYNRGYNLHDENGGAEVRYSDLHNPPSEANHDLTSLDPSNLTVEPGFLIYDDEGLPLDYHLGVTSSLIDAGDPSVQDPDGSLSDIGAYGGPDGTSWDLDGDGYYDYFWPGTILDAPAGFDPANWDCDDMDPEVQACP